MAGCRQACEVEQMRGFCSHMVIFVRVTLETKIFQFLVRHLEPIMACHVFPRYRCAAVGLFLHVLNITAAIINIFILTADLMTHVCERGYF